MCTTGIDAGPKNEDILMGATLSLTCTTSASSGATIKWYSSDKGTILSDDASYTPEFHKDTTLFCSVTVNAQSFWSDAVNVTVYGKLRY